MKWLHSEDVPWRGCYILRHSKKITRKFLYRKAHHHIRDCTPLVSNLSEMKSVHIFPFLFIYDVMIACWNLDASESRSENLESFEMWCWRRMEKISWTDHVRNEVLLRIKEQRNILHEISKRKANWIGHILRRNCFLKQVIEGKIKGKREVTRRWGRRRKKLLDNLKDGRG
jgi:hypothetical protein